MLKNKKYYLIFLFSFLLFVLIACQNDQSQEKPGRDQPNVQLISYTDQQENDINQSVKNRFDQVTDISSITYNDQIVMAIKVDQFSQFNEQKIAEDIQSFIEKEHPNMIKATVSSDYKVFIEIDRLKEKVLNQSITREDFTKRLKEIRDHTKAP